MAEHILVVREVGEPYGPLSTHDWEDWEIEHPDDCPTETVVWGGVEMAEYCCAVGVEISNGGARWSLKYSGTPVEEPGRYPIDVWFETIRGYDYTEYDGGLYVISETED